MNIFETQRLELDCKIQLLQAKLTYACMLVTVHGVNGKYQEAADKFQRELEDVIALKQVNIKQQRENFVSQFERKI